MPPFLPLLPLSSTECNSTQPKHNFPIDLTRHLELVQGNDSWEMTFLPEAAAHAMGNVSLNITLHKVMWHQEFRRIESFKLLSPPPKKAYSLWELIVLS